MSHLAEYYHDPRAPKANSLRPTAYAAVRDADDRLLLVRRSDTRAWELPGGAVEIGETCRQAAVREVLEESGVQVRITGLSGLYSDPGHVIVHPDGEVRQEFALCFHAEPVSGRPRPDQNETVAAGWVSVVDLDGLAIHPSMRSCIDNAVYHPQVVHID